MKKGFTIAELLIVIVVIAILAAISIVAYKGIQNRARNSSISSSLRQVSKLVEAYNAENGNYPITSTVAIVGGATDGGSRYDVNCVKSGGQTDWIPGLSVQLPQSDGNVGSGVGGHGGCYMYMSDGKYYVLSAWNMLKSPQSAEMYRRIGFREMPTLQFYYCNQTNIGGNFPTPYTLAKDYYKHSYTITNIPFCNESPPAGA